MPPSDEKIDILHKQVDILREEIGKLPMRIDDTADNLRNELREAEDRVVGQLGSWRPSFAVSGARLRVLTLAVSAPSRSASF